MKRKPDTDIYQMYSSIDQIRKGIDFVKEISIDFCKTPCEKCIERLIGNNGTCPLMK